MLRFVQSITVHTLSELCQRRWLLAELALLCLFLPLCAGPAAQSLLSEGVSFSGITLAVTAPAGDPLPSLLEEYMGDMTDISQYCSFQAMEEAEAAAALEAGTVTAILSLPEDLVQGIMDGSNPDVQLIVPSDRPLEALLTLWVGQSAAELLSSVQAGIYGVLEIYSMLPEGSLSFDQVKLDINLRYITWTLNRHSIFRQQEVSATEALPAALHYQLSLLAYLGLALAPLFSGIYAKKRLSFRRRLRALGWGSLVCYGGDLAACAALLFLLTALPLLFFIKGPILSTLGAAALFSFFCAVFASLCCLITSNAASCGGMAFSLSLLSTAASGGILPPVLLPATLRAWSWLSPVTWLRTVAALPAGYPAETRVLAVMAVSMLLMAGLSAALYHRRATREEESL